MRYYRRIRRAFWVEVMISTIDESIEARKYRGKALVSAAGGSDFRTTMIHATMTGLEEDEPADQNC